MSYVEEEIQSQGMIPIVRAKNAQQAIGAVNALVRENMKIVEFPWDLADSAKIMEKVKAECRGVRYGCSHVREPKQAEASVMAGAEFLVVSALNRETIDCGKTLGIKVFPVAGTLGEIEEAICQGFDRICIEPVDMIGRDDLFYRLKRTYPGIRFMPRGGITTETAEDYLSFSNVFACGGSWLAPESLMETSSWAAIEELAMNAIYAMLGFRVLSIDFAEFPESVHVSDGFTKMFKLKDIVTFTEETFPEHAPLRLTISTNHIKRSVAYLQSKGYHFLMDKAPKNKNGGYPYVYLADAINGTLVRLLQKNSRMDG